MAGNAGTGSPGAFPPDAPPPSDGDRPRVGVLAIQGDFEEHERMLERLGVEGVEVRLPGQLDDVDGLIIPGGESTTIEKGIAAYGLEAPLRDYVNSGGPVLGTCAGLILLGNGHLGLIDVDTTRNAYGRQVRSFEQAVTVAGLGDEPIEAVFIRAPRIDRYGEEVEVLAELDGDPVVARQGAVLVAAFHPELTDDLRLHAIFVAMVDAAARSSDRESAG